LLIGIEMPLGAATRDAATKEGRETTAAAAERTERSIETHDGGEENDTRRILLLLPLPRETNEEIGVIFLYPAD
jgi:hypothetical protein